MKIIVREAQEKDMTDVINLIKELAEFEKEPNEVEIDSTILVNDGFREKSYFNKNLSKVSITEVPGDEQSMFLPKFIS